MKSSTPATNKTTVTLDRLADLINRDLANQVDVEVLLSRWKCEILREEREYNKLAAKFTFDEVIETFKLKYSHVVASTKISESIWTIEDSLRPFPITPCLSSNILSFYHAL